MGETKMRIAVLGGGHGCYAAAVDFSEAGHEVRMWRRDDAALLPLKAEGAITVKDHKGRRQVPISLFTEDIGQAVKGAELIFSPLPAFAQADVARALAPHLEDGQVVFIPPGTFGSYVMTKAARDLGCRARFAIAETGTLP
jgi:opine dehydrogenase